MTKEEWLKPLAAKVDNNTREFYCELAKRRGETVSEVVKKALLEYAEKTKKLM